MIIFGYSHSWNTIINSKRYERPIRKNGRKSWKLDEPSLPTQIRYSTGLDVRFQPDFNLGFVLLSWAHSPWYFAVMH